MGIFDHALRRDLVIPPDRPFGRDLCTPERSERGSVVGVTDNAGALTAETRYMPSRTMRPRNPRSSGEVGLATPFRVQVCAAMWGR